MKYSFKDIQYNEDDRAQRYLNVFPHLEGQLNVSYVNSTDYWCCIKGSFKVGLATDDGEVRWEYLSEKTQRVLEIPPGIYHGYKALEPGSILMYHLTHKYNPEDEIRAKIGVFGEKWEKENK